MPKCLDLASFTPRLARNGTGARWLPVDEADAMSASLFEAASASRADGDRVQAAAEVCP
jgi:hypothetical protein